MEHHYDCDGFVWGNRRLEVFPLTSLCALIQMHQKNLYIILSPQDFWREHLLKFDDCQNLWCGLISPKAISISALMQLNIRALKNLAAMEVRVIARQFLAIPRSLFLGKEGIQLFFHSSICSDFIQRRSIGAVRCRVSLFSIFMGVFHQDRLLYFLKFLFVLRWVLAYTVLVLYQFGYN